MYKWQACTDTTMCRIKVTFSLSIHSLFLAWFFWGLFASLLSYDIIKRRRRLCIINVPIFIERNPLACNDHISSCTLWFKPIALAGRPKQSKRKKKGTKIGCCFVLISVVEKRENDCPFCCLIARQNISYLVQNCLGASREISKRLENVNKEKCQAWRPRAMIRVFRNWNWSEGVFPSDGFYRMTASINCLKLSKHTRQKCIP